MTMRETVIGALDDIAAKTIDDLIVETGLEPAQVYGVLGQLKGVRCKRVNDGWLRIAAPPPAAEKSPAAICGTVAPKSNGHDNIPTFAKVQPQRAISPAAHPGVDYKLVLADLMARRDKLDAAITAVRSIVGEA